MDGTPGASVRLPHEAPGGPALGDERSRQRQRDGDRRARGDRHRPGVDAVRPIGGCRNPRDGVETGWRRSGGGPAGAATAWALARAGVDVLVCERARFPRAKPCAEYLSPQASRLLAEMGALDAVERA